MTTIRVIVATNYQWAKDEMRRRLLDPRRTLLVYNAESAYRLRGRQVLEDEVLWLGPCHPLVEAIVKSRIRAATWCPPCPPEQKSR